MRLIYQNLGSILLYMNTMSMSVLLGGQTGTKTPKRPQIEGCLQP